jgi:anthranilate phosphoribosyltransferase
MIFRNPHPFAHFINILGRGKTKTRSLTRQEAREAMGMMLAGDVLPEQVGAFLMLLRLKEESPEEIAGFAEASRAAFHKPAAAPAVDLDWPSYAGKRRQLPWYLLAALTLASSGRRVLMHGLDGHTAGRIYSGEALARLGVPVARDANEASEHLRLHDFAYLSLERISAPLADMMGLRPILGLRSPVHTLVRALNPFDATASLQGVFHPGYLTIHREAAILLNRARTVVFRGDGGEGERRPNKPAQIVTVSNGGYDDRRWPATSEDPHQAPDETMDLDRLAAVWRGDVGDEYGEAAAIGTVALALNAMGDEDDPARAQTQAQELWRRRHRAARAAVA